MALSDSGTAVHGWVVYSFPEDDLQCGNLSYSTETHRRHQHHQVRTRETKAKQPRKHTACEWSNELRSKYYTILVSKDQQSGRAIGRGTKNKTSVKKSSTVVCTRYVSRHNSCETPNVQQNTTIEHAVHYIEVKRANTLVCFCNCHRCQPFLCIPLTPNPTPVKHAQNVSNHLLYGWEVIGENDIRRENYNAVVPTPNRETVI